jgi:hypothetical protein
MRSLHQTVETLRQVVALYPHAVSGEATRPFVASVEIADLIGAGLVNPGDEWRFIPGRIRGGVERTPVTATVTEVGGLRIGRKGYGSPSKAARAVCGSPRNGWRFWRFERDGDWVFIDDLRQRYLRRSRRAHA